MNLQEILSYRDVCIHCQRPLKMRVGRYPKLSINVTDEGLKIQSGHKNGVYLFFGHDGRFERGKRNYKIYAGPILIEKRCHFHPLIGNASDPVIKPIILKSRSAGMTTMIGAKQAYDTTFESLKDLTCQYDFLIYGDSQGNYDIKLHMEYLYYSNSKKFWHINTWFGADISKVYSVAFEDKAGNMLNLSLPAINMKSIQTPEQLINKIKMYTLFS